MKLKKDQGSSDDQTKYYHFRQSTQIISTLSALLSFMTILSIIRFPSSHLQPQIITNVVFKIQVFVEIGVSLYALKHVEALSSFIVMDQYNI